MRYLANAIIYRGVVHRDSTVELTADGTVSISPFTTEQHSTVYINGIILIAGKILATDDILCRLLQRAVTEASTLADAIESVISITSSHPGLVQQDIPVPIILNRS